MLNQSQNNSGLNERLPAVHHTASMKVTADVGAVVESGQRAQSITEIRIAEIREALGNLPGPDRYYSSISNRSILHLVALGIIKPLSHFPGAANVGDALDTLRGSPWDVAVGYLFRERWLRKIEDARERVKIEADQVGTGKSQVGFNELTPLGTCIRGELAKLSERSDEVVRNFVMLLERVAPAVFAPSFSYGWPSRLCAYLTDKKSNNDVDAALEYNLYTEAIERVRPRTPEQAVKTLSKVYSLLESDVCRATKLSALIQNAEAHNRNGVSDYMLGAAVSSAFCTFLVGWPTLLATVAITGSGLLSGAMTVLISFATFIRFFQLKTQGVARLLGVASSSVPLSTRSWLDSSPPPEITSPTPSTTTAILAPLTEAKSWLPPSTHASLDELVQVLELACRNQTDPAVTAAVRTSLALSFEIAFKVKGCGVTLPESTQALLIRAFTETKAAITKLTQLAAKHDAKEVVGVELAAAAGGMDSEMKRPRPPLPSFSSDAIS